MASPKKAEDGLGAKAEYASVAATEPDTKECRRYASCVANAMLGRDLPPHPDGYDEPQGTDITWQPVERVDTKSRSPFSLLAVLPKLQVRPIQRRFGSYPGAKNASRSAAPTFSTGCWVVDTWDDTRIQKNQEQIDECIAMAQEALGLLSEAEMESQEDKSYQIGNYEARLRLCEMLSEDLGDI